MMYLFYNQELVKKKKKKKKIKTTFNSDIENSQEILINNSKIFPFFESNLGSILFHSNKNVYLVNYN